MIKRLASVLTLVFVLSGAALPTFGQGAQRTPPAEAYVNEQGFVRVLSGAEITVCPSTGTGSSCNPGTVNLFYDPALTVPMTNPLYADSNGGYSYYVTPGTYGELVCSPGTDCSFNLVTLGGGSGGSGTVTNFTAGDLNPLFTTSVSTGTTTPALSFSLSNVAANTVFGNFTGGSAAPSYNSIAACGDPANALGWLPGAGFYCQAITGGGGVGPGTTNTLLRFTGPTTAGDSTESDLNSTFVSSAVNGINATQGVFNNGSGFPQAIEFDVPNDPTTGTSQFFLAKVVSAVAYRATTGDTQTTLYATAPAVLSEGAALCQAGTSGQACLIRSGKATLTADAGGVAANHFVIASTTVAGAVADAGAGPIGISSYCIGKATNDAIVAASTGIVDIGNCPVPTTTGSGSVVLATTPTVTTPAIVGVPSGDSTTGGAVRLADNVFEVASDFTTANSTDFQNITGLTWTLAANLAQKVNFQCWIGYSQATQVSDAFGIQSASINPTSIDAFGWMGASTTAQTFGNLAGLATTVATAIVTATPTVSTVNGVQLAGTISNPSNASTNVISIMVSQSTGADLIVVKQGSWCRVW